MLLGTSYLGVPSAWGQGNLEVQADQSDACAPAVINFQALAPGATSWKWEIGPHQSFREAPSVLFDRPGTYDLALWVTYPDGRKDSLFRPSFVKIHQKPVAAFSLSQTEACTFVALSFMDQSDARSGQLTHWEWDFGDGSLSYEQHPVHTYARQGVYPVSLVVKNEFGCQHETMVSEAIAIRGPDARFQPLGEVVACGPPLSVAFEGAATVGDHHWSFGDGQTSTEAAPVHTYTRNGSFSVMHVVEDGSNCRDTARMDHLVNIGISTLGLRLSDSVICEGDTLELEAISSSSSQVNWSFGDGGTAAGQKQLHSYSQAGTYEVVAHIADPGGCDARVTKSVTVHARPKARFSLAGPDRGCQLPFEATFINQAEGASTYVWTFGDGASSEDVHPVHTYTRMDSFTVRLTAHSEAGCTAVYEEAGAVVLKPLNPVMALSPSEGCAPLTVELGDSTASPWPITRWQWSFGDGHQSELRDPVHTFEQAGVYDLRLVVTNEVGCSDTLERAEAIKVGTPPEVDFSADTLRVCALDDVHFTNGSSHGDEFLWFFGDGDSAMVENPAHGFSELGTLDVTLVAVDRGCSRTLTRPNYIEVLAPLPLIAASDKHICQLPRRVRFYNFSTNYDYAFWNTAPPGQESAFSYDQVFTEAGSYPVSLTVGNEETGCEITLHDSVQVEPIEAAFVAAPLVGCVPHEVVFEDRSTNALEWHWAMGTGDSTKDQHPVYTYTEPGTYDITLAIKNRLGCEDTLRRTAYIESQHLIPRFAIERRERGCLPFEVSFEDRSLSGANITDWLWEFGDGATSTEQHPTHVYDSLGNFSIRLTVTNELGCSKTRVVHDMVQATQPRAAFEVNYPTNCPENAITFVSFAQGEGLRYAWDFGDGATDSLANPVHAYGQPGTYDVALQVTDMNGCQSEVQKPALMHIAPLSAEFEADTTYASCPPLNVHFQPVNSSAHSDVSWEWQFGDGAKAYHASPEHNYTAAGVYDVQLLLGSPSGCRDTVVQQALIRIDGPQGRFDFSPKAVCPGAAVMFEAQTQHAVRQQWIFGDGATDFSEASTHVYEHPGLYAPALLIEDSLGCKVILEAPGSLRVHEPPVARAEVEGWEVCPQLPLAFSDASSFSAPLVGWQWTFGDGGSATDPSPNYAYQAAGRYEVSLAIEDAHGCSDRTTMDQLITVLPDELPTPVEMKHVSVLGNHRIELRFAAYDPRREDFGAYHIYRSQGNGWQWVDSLSDRRQTRWVDEAVETRHFSYCYKVVVANHCGRAHALDAVNRHCSVELQATSGEDEVALHWNAYVGWEPQAWQLFRVGDYAHTADEPLATLPGFETTFVDDQLFCYEGHAYRIEAVGEHARAWSDTVQAAPIHKPPQEPVQVLRVSVENNEFIQLDWKTPPVDRLHEVVVERKVDGQGNFQEVYREPRPLENNKFQDVQVNVQADAYRYRAFALDSCGDRTPLGRRGNSMLLQVSRKHNHAQLQWNPYEGWEKGVDAYEIQRKDPSTGLYAPLTRLSLDKHSYQDLMQQEEWEIYCYRVIAYEHEGTEMDSYSNEACLVPEPILYVPNAFTPNGDGHNDSFDMESLFVKNVHVRIYNRWGLKVFESRNLTSSWNGLGPDGKACPEGVYVLRISGTSFEDKPVNKTSSIVLIR